ncbi:MAG: hypothetical protein WDN06_18235 [Asticcacaulis sp.]
MAVVKDLWPRIRDNFDQYAMFAGIGLAIPYFYFASTIPGRPDLPVGPAVPVEACARSRASCRRRP